MVHLQSEITVKSVPVRLFLKMCRRIQRLSACRGKIVIQNDVRVNDDLDQVHLPDPVQTEMDDLKSENARLRVRLDKLEKALESVKNP